MADKRESFINHRSITVPAGGKVRVEVGGRVFYCQAATAPFEMEYDDNGFFPVRGTGVQWSLAGVDERFRRLVFKSDVAQTIEFYTGQFSIFENVVVPVIQVAKTFARPGVTSIAATTNVDLETVPAGRKYRKSIVVTNNDPAVDIEIYMKDAAGAYQLAATVFFRQAWYLETSDAIRVRNASAGAVNCRILELFY